MQTYPPYGHSSDLCWTPGKQSGLCNAQDLFTGKDRTDGPKDKFNPVLNLTVILIFPQTGHCSGEPPRQEMPGERPQAAQVCEVGPPCRQSELGRPHG